MTTQSIFAAVEPPSSVVVRARSGLSMGERQRLLALAIRSSDDEASLLRKIARLLPAYHQVEYVLHIAGQTQIEVTPLYGTDGQPPECLRRQLAERLESPASAATLELEPLAGEGPLLAVVTPIPGTEARADALAVVTRACGDPIDALSAAVELAAFSVWLWRLGQRSMDSESDCRSTAALVELVQRVSAADDLPKACSTLVHRLKTFLECERVVLGICSAPKRPCRIVGDSRGGGGDVSREDELAWRAVLDEVILRNGQAVWPTQQQGQRQGLLTLKQLGDSTGSESVIAAPLRDDQGRLVGAWAFLGNDQLAHNTRTIHFLAAAKCPVATCLRLQQRSMKGKWSNAVNRTVEWAQCWPGRITFALLILAAAALAWPTAYRIPCDCELQPVTRRFVAAPFGGILQRTFFEPGDLVARDQVLAEMDGREIRWELAGVAAEMARAEKQRDGYLANGQFGPAELTRYEIERLRLKTELLEHRDANLEIRSPIDGMVIRGDLKKAEGAPVQVGQTLFEVSPLGAMVVEIAIADEDVVFAHPGAEVEVVLDAFPERRWQGSLERVHPRSEVKDEEHVFLAEITLESNRLPLRPGMQGKARIGGPRRSWAWILLHKPWQKLTLWWGW